MRGFVSLLIAIPWALIFCRVAQIRDSFCASVIGGLFCLAAAVFINQVWPDQKSNGTGAGHD